MYHEFIYNFYEFLKYLLSCPFIGFALYIVIFEFYKSFSLSNENYYKSMSKKRKIKCWLYLSVLSFIVAMLIRTFSSCSIAVR